MIASFRNQFDFLSNFYDSNVAYHGIVYKNNEAAFQAQKTIDNRERVRFSYLSASEAKKLGRKVSLRKDWEQIKDRIMYEICLAKFCQNKELKDKLLATGDEYIEEGNTWNDRVWGTVDGVGENRLGKILMKVRSELAMNKFDAYKVKNDCVSWIKNWFNENGRKCNAIVGISGGKDSSVVAALCVEALGKDRVIGVLMPNGVQNDINDSMKLIEHLKIRFVEANIQEAYQGVLNSIGEIFVPEQDGYEPFKISEQTTINLPARIRMATLYAVSQSLNGRVANTCNLSEDYVGYATRYGDGAGDFSPLSRLTTDEVIDIGIELGLPSELVYKTPTDGLCGKTDEDNLGFTYDVLNRYIRAGFCEDEVIKRKIDTLHMKNLFKLQTIPCFEYKN